MRYRIALIIAGLFAVLAVAQDEAPESGVDTEVPQTEGSETADNDAAADETSDVVTGAADARAAADDDIFVPTDEFAPDEQVNFPVDI